MLFRCRMIISWRQNETIFEFEKTWMKLPASPTSKCVIHYIIIRPLKERGIYCKLCVRMKPFYSIDDNCNGSETVQMLSEPFNQINPVLISYECIAGVCETWMQATMNCDSAQVGNTSSPSIWFLSHHRIRFIFGNRSWLRSHKPSERNVTMKMNRFHMDLMCAV